MNGHTVSHNSDWVKMCLLAPIWCHCSLWNLEANDTFFRGTKLGLIYDNISSGQPLPLYHLTPSIASFCLFLCYFHFPFTLPYQISLIQCSYTSLGFVSQRLCVCVRARAHACVFTSSCQGLSAHATLLVTHQSWSGKLYYIQPLKLTEFL